MPILKALITALNDFSHLFFPHNCVGCGSDVLPNDSSLCAKCFNELPETNFLHQSDNPAEKIFYGRVPIEYAGSAFYFTKDSIVQRLMIDLKYRRNKAAGIYMGKLLGLQLAAAARFASVDALVPLPLNPKKEKMRGYNQALIICEGIQTVWPKPIIKDAIGRKLFTETQTHKSRLERQQNMQDVFAVTNAEALTNKHLLLIDDVVTTGASLEACAATILKTVPAKISIATVAYTI